MSREGKSDTSRQSLPESESLNLQPPLSAAAVAATEALDTSDYRTPESLLRGQVGGLRGPAIPRDPADRVEAPREASAFPMLGHQPTSGVGHSTGHPKGGKVRKKGFTSDPTDVRGSLLSEQTSTSDVHASVTGDAFVYGSHPSYLQPLEAGGKPATTPALDMLPPTSPVTMDAWGSVQGPTGPTRTRILNIYNY